MPKKKQSISTLKSIYLVLIVLLPIYAAFTIQLLPREHHGEFDGGQGWPFIVCGPVDSIGDVGLLLLNASLIFTSIYLLVLISAAIRYRFFNQAADGSKLKKTTPSRKKS